MDAVDGEEAEHQVVQRQNARFGSAHGIALILLAAAMALAPYATARFGFRGLVVAYAIAVVAWLPLLSRSLPDRITLIIAVALRLSFLFHDPYLSGDVYRYLSDGRTLAGGDNPYAYTPNHSRINHPEIRSVYPPHAQLLFAIVHHLIAWRLLIIAADVAAIILLRRHGAALAFATCPLVLIEGTWSGHLDALAAVLLAFALAHRSGVAAALAAGLKIIPLAAVPALWRMSSDRQRRRLMLSFPIALVLPVIPFIGGPIMPGFRDYATRWIFNSPLYDLLRTIVERIPTKDIWTSHPLRVTAISDLVYRYLYSDFVTRAILAAIAIGGIVLARRVTTAIAVLLVCSPAVHPWYWLTLVPAALIERSRWLYIALAMPLSYLLYEGLSPLYVWAAAGLVAALAPHPK